MTTLLEIHERHFNPTTGVFNSRPFAGMVVEHMLRLYPKALGLPIDSRSIATNGKHDITVEFPRLRHVWWPKANTAEAISAEFDEVLKLFQAALGDAK